MSDLESVEGGPMLREERAFLRALAMDVVEGWTRGGPARNACIEAAVGALSVSGEAPTKPWPRPLWCSWCRTPYTCTSVPGAWKKECGCNEPSTETRPALAAPPPEKEPRPMWKLEMTCCGREEPPSYHATWEEADATREAWLSNAEHGRGHSDRSATIVRAAPPKEPPAPQRTDLPRNCSGPETRSVEEILAELLLMWGDSCRTLAMLRNIQRLYRAEKEASARTLAEYRRGLASCNDFSVTLRAERDAALLDSKESMTLYRQNRARLEAERDDLAARLKNAAEVATRRTFLREDLLAILERGGSSGKGDR